MPSAIGITRDEHSAAELRRAAARCRDSAASRRMLALALVKEGQSRTDAARSCGMDRQTLRDWVHRYNEDGLDGLADRWGGGCKPRLSPLQRDRLVALVRSGPDVAVHGVVRWRRIDLARVMAAEFGVVLAERTVGKLLRALGFSRISARPRHPEQDSAAQEAHKKTLPAWSLPPSRIARGQPVELWWQDEARVGQQGTLTYVWADKGSRPRAPRDLRYEWAYIFGAVCPGRGCGAALVLPHANTEAMNLHLAEISRNVAAGAHAVVVLDGAGWHQTGGRLRLPDNISLLHLPPYSPELNPVENVWQYLPQNYLSNRVFADYGTIVEACCTAWNTLMDMPERITSIATRHWA